MQYRVVRHCASVPLGKTLNCLMLFPTFGPSSLVLPLSTMISS